MVADMLNDININPVVTKIFIRGRKLYTFLVFINQSCFALQKDIRLNSTYYFLMKILNKQDFHQTASHHSSYLDFKDFINLHKKCTAKPYSF